MSHQSQRAIHRPPARADGPPWPGAYATAERRILLLAEPGTWLPERMWGAAALARKRLGRFERAPPIDCRLVHDGQGGLPLARQLWAKRLASVVWLDDPHALAYAALGYGAVIAVEAGGVNEMLSLGVPVEPDDLDFDPTPLDRALWQLAMPVIRFRIHWESSTPMRYRPRPVIRADRAGGSAVVSFPAGPRAQGNEPRGHGDEEVLARLIVGLVSSSQVVLNEDEIADWIG